MKATKNLDTQSELKIYFYCYATMEKSEASAKKAGHHQCSLNDTHHKSFVKITSFKLYSSVNKHLGLETAGIKMTCHYNRSQPVSVLRFYQIGKWFSSIHEKLIVRVQITTKFLLAKFFTI